MNGTDQGLSVELQVAVNEPAGLAQADCRTWVAAALKAAGHPLAGSLTVRLVDETESESLNSQYRNKPGPTNVLAFPGPGEAVPDGPAELGDLAVCWPVTENEAAAQEKPVLQHFAHLVVHGTLHLIGYDHVQAGEAEAMEQLEISALKQMGIANPYA